jgi:hypothetical protein
MQFRDVSGPNKFRDVSGLFLSRRPMVGTRSGTSRLETFIDISGPNKFRDVSGLFHSRRPMVGTRSGTSRLETFIDISGLIPHAGLGPAATGLKSCNEYLVLFT